MGPWQVEASTTLTNALIDYKFELAIGSKASNFDGCMKHLQICMFESYFYLQQVKILHLDVKVENVQLITSTVMKVFFRFFLFKVCYKYCS